MKKFLIALLCVCSLFAVTACKDKTSGGSSESESTSGVEISSGEASGVKIYLNTTAVSVRQYAFGDIFCSYSGTTDPLVWTIAEGGESLISVEPTESGCRVNGLNVGETTLTVTVGGVSEQIAVTVDETDLYPTLQLSQEKAQPKVGGSITVGAKLMLETMELEADFVYTSANTDVATVTQEGVITGVAAGETTVEVRVDYNGEIIVGTITVTVVA